MDDKTALNNLLRNIKIKTGVIKRYVKEYRYYEKEAQKHLEKLNAMKEDSSVDEYNVKKFNDVVLETKSMIPLTALNVKKSCTELKQMIETNETLLGGTAQLDEARQEIALAEEIQ